MRNEISNNKLLALRWAAAYFFHGSDQKILDFQNQYMEWIYYQYEVFELVD